jgi:ABC-type dipeptide/oligopeptide/nickel transport system permease component
VPIVTVVGLTTALMISGAVVTETVFACPAWATSSSTPCCGATIR